MSSEDREAERSKLKQAMDALEGQRAVLGDAVVDASITALRRQLMELQAPDKQRQRKQATILFMDIVDSTEIVRDLDPEENLAVMETALARLAQPIQRYGGRVARYTGDGFKAVFGLPRAQENDPDRAVNAALDILEEAKRYAAELLAKWHIPAFDVRLGVSTGWVAAGGGTEAEDTLVGTTVNLAARLESAAEPGTLLISHDTYLHVRGAFDLQPHEPIKARGFPVPVPAYQVLSRKARSFRTRRRGVEGIETQMIGRNWELEQLQQAFQSMFSSGTCRAATVVGEAGMGKSRLLYEFENWVDLQSEVVELFRARARQESQGVPYGVLRDLFAFRLGIQDDAAAAIVREKLVRHFVDAAAVDQHSRMSSMPEIQAHFVGHLLGYDFGDSIHLAPVMNDPYQLRERAFQYLADYFGETAARQPLLLMLEDLHWADDSSLDALSRVVTSLSSLPAMMVAAVRPDFLNRRRSWAEEGFHRRIDLSPLSEDDSRLLVDEVLQKVEDAPDALRALIVQSGEGNPFYVEELVKMLIEEGVILKEELSWRVAAERLTSLRVPATLTGVLQARLDALPHEEREILQQSSVAGRVFWDKLILHINQKSGGDLDKIVVESKLNALASREMIYRTDSSAFTGSVEHMFKHALLREVTYESVTLNNRQLYHGLAADWLMLQSGERAGEVAGTIADHLERAGRKGEALIYLRRAAESASRMYANEEALAYLGRALALASESDLASRFDLLLVRVEIWNFLGQREAQLADLNLLHDLADRLQSRSRRALLALQRAEYAQEVTDYPAAILVAQEVIDAAPALGLTGLALKAYNIWSTVLWRQGEYDEAGSVAERLLALARKARFRREEASALNSLGAIALNQGRPLVAKARFEQALQITRQLWDRWAEARILANVGVCYMQLADFARARRVLDDARSIEIQVGDRRGLATSLNNLADVANITGDYAAAIEFATEALATTRAIGDRDAEGFSLVRVADALAGQGDWEASRRMFRESASLREEIGQTQNAAVSWAGVARAALAQGDLSSAMEEAGKILAFLGDEGELDAGEDPLRVYLTLFQVLQAAGDQRAEVVLGEAYQRLQTVIDRSEDESTRRRLVENVLWHREIVSLWEARDGKAQNGYGGQAGT